VYSALIKNEQTLRQRNFMLVKPFTTAQGRLKGCKVLWSVVSVRALNQAKNILMTCCEFWIDKQ